MYRMLCSDIALGSDLGGPEVRKKKMLDHAAAVIKILFIISYCLGNICPGFCNYYACMTSISYWVILRFEIEITPWISAMSLTEIDLRVISTFHSWAFKNHICAPFWPPIYLCGYFLCTKHGQIWQILDHLSTPSCPRGYWMPPGLLKNHLRMFIWT